MQTVNRQGVINRLSRQNSEFLKQLETDTGLVVQFEPLNPGCEVIAQYRFNPPDGSVISLRQDYEDFDIAHELIHMQLELVEGYYVLAWRQHVKPEYSIERAFARVRVYVDDEVVHARLVKKGY
jgi:hypothetical protein